MSERLKPCPFCGGEAYISEPSPVADRHTGVASYQRMFVECVGCGAHPYSVECYSEQSGRDSLTAMWNRREPSKVTFAMLPDEDDGK